MNTLKKAVVLLSGGLDSTTALAIAQEQGFDVNALSFNYGQRHSIELKAAKQIARNFEVQQHVVGDIDLRLFGGSALTDDIEVPKYTSAISSEESVPVTYVPARNTIFLSFALAWAEVLGSIDIFIGVSAVDYSGYPDCRPEYIAAFQSMARLATVAGADRQQEVTIHTPLINLSKAETILRGMALGVDYSDTISCYDPVGTGISCGLCDACVLRRRGFAEAGCNDPTQYQSSAKDF